MKSFTEELLCSRSHSDSCFRNARLSRCSGTSKSDTLFLGAESVEAVARKSHVTVSMC